VRSIAYLLTDLKKATRPIKSFIDSLEQEEEPFVPSQKGPKSTKDGGNQKAKYNALRTDEKASEPA
jgi:hypothetical protein